VAPAVGFIGFGEAGSAIAGGLHGAGVERLSAFDIRTHTTDFGPRIHERARHAETTLVDSPADLVRRSDVIFSTVTSSSALDAASAAAGSLESRHLYADLNSVSPAVKVEIDRIIGRSGANFVEVAVMAPVLPYGHKVPMLAGGAGARAFAAAMGPFGLRVELLDGAKVGSAAAVKMCRSIVVKGLEALLFECVMGASRFGADDLVWASLKETYPGIDWKALADYTSGRVVVHGERRAREMEEVAETLRAIGVNPIMAEATARRQDWTAQLDLRSRFGAEGPSTYQEVLDAIAAVTSPGSSRT
jgi:3-hydroxyisobutyrate dehydrogenase-like beta-hydroxyacid dehydrogenase